jgi:hypothetical protein
LLPGEDLGAVATIDPALVSETGKRASWARQILVQAALLGLLGDAMLRDAPWGIGWTICISALASTVALLLLRRGAQLTREQSTWLLLSVACAVAFAARDAEMLQLANVVATIFALAMAAMSLSGGPQPSILASRLRDVLRAWRYAARDALAGAVPLWAREANAPAAVRASTAGRSPALRATILTLPLVLIFGKLLAGADPVFASLFSVPEMDLGDLASHVIVAGIFAWLCAGWMHGALVSAGNRPAAGERLPFALGVVEITASLGALNALFALFVGMQVTWLFGGENIVRETTGLTLAGYARHGFFELVSVAALVFPVLLVTRAAAAGDDEALRRHRRLAMPLLGFLAAIMLSAVFRMRLYVLYFGLTTDRLYALVLMGWLAIVFVCMAMTVLRGWSRPFATMTVASAYGTLFLLNVASPEALVARVDLARSASARPVDYAYLATLSGDASPMVAMALQSAAPNQESCRAARMLHARWARRPYRAFPQWNLGAARGESVVLARLTPHSLRRLCGSSRT